MKSMKQMQDEMLAKCRFDGSYPRPIHMGMGIIALAHDEEQERLLLKSNETLLWVVLAGFGLILAGCIGFVLFATLR